MKKPDPHIHRRIVTEILSELCSGSESADFLQAVEVGVSSGALSEMVLRSIPRMRLVMIDPWKKHFDGTKSSRKRTKAEVEAVYRYAQHRTKFAEDRRLIVRTASVIASRFWPDEIFDFVFIDGLHFYDSVKEDVSLWWPKVKRGGILAGHDYFSPRNNTGVWGVQRAVDEFVEVNSLPLSHRETVWLVEKP